MECDTLSVASVKACVVCTNAVKEITRRLTLYAQTHTTNTTKTLYSDSPWQWSASKCDGILDAALPQMVILRTVHFCIMLTQ